ncbi:hypothetical protein ACPJHQ_08130 [Rossellomorea sp. H39__3]
MRDVLHPSLKRPRLKPGHPDDDGICVSVMQTVIENQRKVFHGLLK